MYIKEWTELGLAKPACLDEQREWYCCSLQDKIDIRTLIAKLYKLVEDKGHYTLGHPFYSQLILSF